MPVAAPHTLSKSAFMMEMQCPKRLWLHKHRIGFKDGLSIEQVAIFQAGPETEPFPCHLFERDIDASAAFYKLKHTESREENGAVRKALPEYCGPDTWEMVRILEKLKSI